MQLPHARESRRIEWRKKDWYNRREAGRQKKEDSRREQRPSHLWSHRRQATIIPCIVFRIYRGDKCCGRGGHARKDVKSYFKIQCEEIRKPKADARVLMLTHSHAHSHTHTLTHSLIHSLTHTLPDHPLQVFEDLRPALWAPTYGAGRIAMEAFRNFFW